MCNKQQYCFFGGGSGLTVAKIENMGELHHGNAIGMLDGKGWEARLRK